MSNLIIDGKKEAIQNEQALKLEDFLVQIRNQYNRDDHVIASLKVDGVELTEEKEVEFSNFKIAEFDTVEVQTLTRAEMSLQMMESVSVLLHEMLELIERITVQENKTIIYQSFTKLIDGLQAFTETVQTVRIACKIVNNQNIALMEADLLSVMKDLLHYCSLDQVDYLKSVLKNDLPVCVNEWLNEGIPAIIEMIHGRRS